MSQNTIFPFIRKCIDEIEADGYTLCFTHAYCIREQYAISNLINQITGRTLAVEIGRGLIEVV